MEFLYNPTKIALIVNIKSEQCIAFSLAFDLKIEYTKDFIIMSIWEETIQS